MLRLDNNRSMTTVIQLRERRWNMSSGRHVNSVATAAHRSSHYGGEVALGLNRAHGSVNLPSSLVFPRPLVLRHAFIPRSICSKGLWCNAAAIFAPICSYVQGAGVRLRQRGSRCAFSAWLRIHENNPDHAGSVDIKTLVLYRASYGRGSRRIRFLSRPVLTWWLTQDGL